jgi:hypothetical protein
VPQFASVAARQLLATPQLQLSVVIKKHEMRVGGGTNSPVLNAGNKGVVRKSKSRVVTG